MVEKRNGRIEDQRGRRWQSGLLGVAYTASVWLVDGRDSVRPFESSPWTTSYWLAVWIKAFLRLPGHATGHQNSNRSPGRFWTTREGYVHHWRERKPRAVIRGNAWYWVSLGYEKDCREHSQKRAYNHATMVRGETWQRVRDRRTRRTNIMTVFRASQCSYLNLMFYCRDLCCL